MTYLDELRQSAIQQASKPITPGKVQQQNLTVQIREWHAALPVELRQAPRTMDELIKLLPGRSGSGRQARAGDISDCLLSLGWKQKRSWKGPRFRRIWVPPVC